MFYGDDQNLVDDDDDDHHHCHHYCHHYNCKIVIPRNAGDEIKLLVCDGFNPASVPNTGRLEHSQRLKIIYNHPQREK